MATLKQQLMAFMNETFKTKAHAQVFVKALKEVKAEDPTRMDWTLDDVLYGVSVVLEQWSYSRQEENAYRIHMDKAVKYSKSDYAMFEVAEFLSNLGYRGY